MRVARLVLFTVFLPAAAIRAVAACSTEDDATSNVGSPDGGGSVEDGSGGNQPDASEDVVALDAASGDADARPGKDANGPGEAGAECSFNRNCQAALRCECNGSCACAPGARGTGQNGIDACDSGNDCESALCLEGPGGGYLCSDECDSAADCPQKLPRCIDVSFVGRICVRQP